MAFVRIGDDPAVQPTEFGTYMYSAVQCFSGEPDPSDSTQCNAPWVVWIAVIAVNATHDLCTIAIAKYTSAATESLWASAALILTNILFLVTYPLLPPHLASDAVCAGTIYLRPTEAVTVSIHCGQRVCGVCRTGSVQLGTRSLSTAHLYSPSRY